jgi:hypothetical protein
MIQVVYVGVRTGGERFFTHRGEKGEGVRPLVSVNSKGTGVEHGECCEEVQMLQI